LHQRSIPEYGEDSRNLESLEECLRRSSSLLFVANGTI
jgi:hypothetical protein